MVETKTSEEEKKDNMSGSNTPTSPTSPTSPSGRERSGSRRLSQSDTTRTVVVAVDSSDNARVAFDWYIENMWRNDDMIVLVHCPEAPRLPTFSFKSGIGPPVDEWKKILDDMNARTRKLEEDYETTCITKKLKFKVRGEAMKNPGEGIIKICDEERAHAIVMGTRGIGGVKRAFLGSVSEYVMRNSHVPVTIVPAKRWLKRRESESQLAAPAVETVHE